MSERVSETELFAGKLGKVLESMAFIFADESSVDELTEEPGDCLVAEISFQGPCRGTMVVAVQFPLCVEIAVNMLGTDEEDLEEAMIADALKELLNMACGQFLTASFGTEPVFDLTVPRVERIDKAAWFELSSRQDSVALEAEDYQLVAGLSIEGRD